VGMIRCPICHWGMGMPVPHTRGDAGASKLAAPDLLHAELR
jgi:hypothetical protein